MAVNKKLAAKGGAVGAVVAAILGSVFMLEGGYVNDPKDPGGETNHGVTKKVAQSHKEVLAKEYGWDGTMKGLTKEMAAEIYIDEVFRNPDNPLRNIVMLLHIDEPTLKRKVSG